MRNEYARRIMANAREMADQSAMLLVSMEEDMPKTAVKEIEAIENCIAVIEYSLEKLKKQLDGK